ncbi:hypothetical protein IW261DRAFT_305190 [Armillaria novae-zelandiae]|uniref:Uncharacterized protein n=1 Tax=Armillaria novae-zelandiae TaxID=153914 RepID=A0AA39P4N8_9AGAR|nr:hypothetical protein IW261DRAFT_305190 [Armillaria novae-zelandiae]
MRTRAFHGRALYHLFKLFTSTEAQIPLPLRKFAPGAQRRHLLEIVSRCKGPSCLFFSASPCYASGTMSLTYGRSTFQLSLSYAGGHSTVTSFRRQESLFSIPFTPPPLVPTQFLEALLQRNQRPCTLTQTCTWCS